MDVVLLHRNKKYLSQCCRLINDEWKRSETARLRSLECSCDTLPTCLVLLKDDTVIGHLKLTPIPSIRDACFVESVVIERALRGKGYGTVLMGKAEEYCKRALRLKTIYLSTKGQEKFYAKLGYSECRPISIYGSFTPADYNAPVPGLSLRTSTTTTPATPAAPLKNASSSTKTYMRKELDFV